MRKLSVCLSVCLSVRPSVRPSVKRVHCDKTAETSVQIFIPYERPFSLVFYEEEWLVGATPSTWNFGSTGARLSEIGNFEPIFARIASAVTLSEKVQLTLIGSPLRAFQWAIVCCPYPPKGAEKRKTADFRLKSHFAWRKSATKFLCVKTVSDKVVRHSLA